MEDTKAHADAELRRHLEPAISDAGATLLLERLLPPGTEVVTITQLDGLERRLDARFEEIDARFEQIDARFEQIDARFEEFDARFEQIDARFEQIDARFELIDARFEQIHARFEPYDLHILSVGKRFDEIALQLTAQAADLTQTLHDVVWSAIRSQVLYVLFGTLGLFLALVAGAVGIAALL